MARNDRTWTLSFHITSFSVTYCKTPCHNTQQARSTFGSKLLSQDLKDTLFGLAG